MSELEETLAALVQDIEADYVRNKNTQLPGESGVKYRHFRDKTSNSVDHVLRVARDAKIANDNETIISRDEYDRLVHVSTLLDVLIETNSVDTEGYNAAIWKLAETR